jgi:hypothetical protein
MSTKRPFAKLQAAAAATCISDKMSDFEIQSWVQQVHGDVDEGTGFGWEGLDKKWDEFLRYAQLQVTSGKTKIRIMFLHERLLPLVARAGVQHKPDVRPTAADNLHTRAGSAQDH